MNWSFIVAGAMIIGTLISAVGAILGSLKSHQKVSVSPQPSKRSSVTFTNSEGIEITMPADEFTSVRAKQILDAIRKDLPPVTDQPSDSEPRNV